MQIHLHLRCARGIARMDAILIVPKRFGKTPWLKLSGTATGRRLEFVELDSSAHNGQPLTVRQKKAHFPFQHDVGFRERSRNGKSDYLQNYHQKRSGTLKQLPWRASNPLAAVIHKETYMGRQWQAGEGHGRLFPGGSTPPLPTRGESPSWDLLVCFVGTPERRGRGRRDPAMEMGAADGLRLVRIQRRLPEGLCNPPISLSCWRSGTDGRAPRKDGAAAGGIPLPEDGESSPHTKTRQPAQSAGRCPIRVSRTLRNDIR